MTDYALHEPDYDGTTVDDWDAPRLADVGTDDRSVVDDHVLLSASGFPPDAFGDLELPVVSPDGRLNENALQAAHGGAHGVEAVDDDTASDVEDLLERLSRSAFDAGIGA